MPFRQNDVRRVQSAIDMHLPEGFTAAVTLEDSRRTLMVQIPDPANDALTVAQVSFPFDESPGWRNRLQPTNEDAEATATRLAAICAAYVSPAP